MADDRRAAKQSVLTKVNTVLATAGLNDTVWSVRDCDSTLFVLMYKKIVGKASFLAFEAAHSPLLLIWLLWPTCACTSR
jgi:hypothetical protein